jgi:hypothetical protein
MNEMNDINAINAINAITRNRSSMSSVSSRRRRRSVWEAELMRSVLTRRLARLILTDPFDPAAITSCCDLLAEAVIDPDDSDRSVALVEDTLRAVVEEVRRQWAIRRSPGETPWE